MVAIEIVMPLPGRYLIVGNEDDDFEAAARNLIAGDSALHVRRTAIRAIDDLRANEEGWLPHFTEAYMEDAKAERDERKAWEWASEMAGSISDPA
jgi:hypothetical protein